MANFDIGQQVIDITTNENVNDIILGGHIGVVIGIRNYRSGTHYVVKYPKGNQLLYAESSLRAV